MKIYAVHHRCLNRLVFTVIQLVNTNTVLKPLPTQGIFNLPTPHKHGASETGTLMTLQVIHTVWEIHIGRADGIGNQRINFQITSLA